MALIYLDASVLVALFLDDPFGERADHALREPGADLIVSDFAAAEFASSVARHVRMGEVTRQEAADAFSDFDLWQVHCTILLPWTQRICHQTRPTIDALLALRIFDTAGV